MTLLHSDDRPELDAGVRATLHRLAARVDAHPPAWEELIERHEAVVVPLASSQPYAEVRKWPSGRVRRPRLGLVAATVLVLALAAALVVDRIGSVPTERPAAQVISAVSPGDPSFDAATAAAVWATGSPDPVTGTLAYLRAMGVPADATASPAAALRSTTGPTAVVDWSLPGAPGSSRGSVFLRSTSVAGGPPIWTVVGAAASDVALTDVRYDGSELSFTVARTSAAAVQLAVGAWVDGRPVSLGAEPVVQAGTQDVSLGDLVDMASGVGAHETLAVPAAADDIVTLRVVHVVDGTVRSLTQMAIALPDADPAMVAAGAPPLDAAGQATGQVDAGSDGPSGQAGADGARRSGGIDVVPGATLPTLPQLPPLPSLPAPPGAPVPTLPVPTLPAPPTTLLGSVTDRLP
jgi:hypothetical protein